MKSMLIKIILVVAVVGVVAVLYYLKSGGTIAGDEAKSLVDRGATLVDVRTSAEYAAGHIDGAVNIPVHELPARMDELGAKDSELVVYCLSGGRSRQAKQLLEEAGYANVHDLGGMYRWP